MELKAHFSNIHNVIIKHLALAQSEIVVAIAWFTDRDIFEMLCQKVQSGIKVSIALIGDEINQGPGGLNFQRLSSLGGQVVFLPPGSRSEGTMHHKFCVIDRSTVITGSYNWSQKARSNDENITVVTDAADFAVKFVDTFENLLTRVGQGLPHIVDTEAARRRLQMICNLILLGEADDIAPHLRKLRPVAETLHITQIIDTLEKGEYKAALEHIDTYLRQATALVVAGQTEIAGLRLQLEILELRLESLTDEKAELERLLITFNQRHDSTLGDLIQLILKARAKLANLLATTKKHEKERVEAEKNARDAEEAFRDYSQQHEEMQRSEPIPRLDEEAERELKALYRKACSLCHPDKVTEDQKEAAHRAFVELQDAYQSNDLFRLREIYDALKKGGIPRSRSTTLTETESLQAAIAELEYAITKLILELKALQESDGVLLMETAGANEADWQSFLEKQRLHLERELARVESEIKNVQTQGTETND